MKGFKKDGKFRPTERKKKLLTKNQISPAVSNASGRGIGKSELDKIIETKTNTIVDPDYGMFIANGYDDLINEPNNPEVRKAYDRFIDETLDQAKELQNKGMKFESTNSHSYKDAQDMFDDIDKNNHIFYRPSDNDYKGIEDHPLFRVTDFKNVNGEKMRANDVFRVVHDINGHYQSKGKFTPNGEQKAFVEHKKLYSAEAIKALFTETQGQGNWINFNPESGKKNREFQDIGELEKLKFPKQKAVLYPDGIIF